MSLEAQNLFFSSSNTELNQLYLLKNKQNKQQSHNNNPQNPPNPITKIVLGYFYPSIVEHALYIYVHIHLITP